MSDTLLFPSVAFGAMFRMRKGNLSKFFGSDIEGHRISVGSNYFGENIS